MSEGNDNHERRSYERFPTRLQVDYRTGENFLFSYIENISEVGIFIRSDEPLSVGSELHLRFEHDGTQLELEGVVMWVNPLKPEGENLNPGMGVEFKNLSTDDREQLVEIVRTVAYLDNDEQN